MKKIDIIQNMWIAIYDPNQNVLPVIETYFHPEYKQCINGVTLSRTAYIDHVILPSSVALSVIFASTSMISIPILSTLLMTASVLGALALQITIYQNKNNNYKNFSQNPWITHNLMAFGLTVIAYLALMANPLAALIAVATVMTLAPLASMSYLQATQTSLFSQPNDNKSTASLNPGF